MYTTSPYVTKLKPPPETDHSVSTLSPVLFLLGFHLNDDVYVFGAKEVCSGFSLPHTHYILSPTVCVCVKTQAKGSNCFLEPKISRRWTFEWSWTVAVCQSWALPLSACLRLQIRPGPTSGCRCLQSVCPVQEEAGKKHKYIISKWKKYPFFTFTWCKLSRSVIVQYFISRANFTFLPNWVLPDKDNLLASFLLRAKEHVSISNHVTMW